MNNNKPMKPRPPEETVPKRQQKHLNGQNIKPKANKPIKPTPNPTAKPMGKKPVKF